MLALNDTYYCHISAILLCGWPLTWGIHSLKEREREWECKMKVGLLYLDIHRQWISCGKINWWDWRQWCSKQRRRNCLQMLPRRRIYPTIGWAVLQWCMNPVIGHFKSEQLSVYSCQHKLISPLLHVFTVGQFFQGYREHRWQAYAVFFKTDCRKHQSLYYITEPLKVQREDRQIDKIWFLVDSVMRFLVLIKSTEYSKQGCKWDVSCRDRDETETERQHWDFGVTRLRRDRDVGVTVSRPRPRHQCHQSEMRRSKRRLETFGWNIWTVTYTISTVKYVGLYIGILLWVCIHVVTMCFNWPQRRWLGLLEVSGSASAMWYWYLLLTPNFNSLAVLKFKLSTIKK